MAQSEAILKSSDFALVRFSAALAPLLRALGEFEQEVLAKRLHGIRIDAPVFVTGLARSGTTMMLTVLSQADGVATHRYRDFPFLFAPLVWNWFQDRIGAHAGDPVERPHRDRIRITKESAEAFEEPLWQAFFPWTHDASRCHLMDERTSNRAFEACFDAHLRKILLLRKGRRYLSKGNYNVARIEYLARVFPDARFVIPIREPLSHVRSLVEQHARFCRYAADDPRVPAYLAAAGHYEFGPQRRPVCLDPARIGEIDAAWRAGDEYGGYARQWAQVYAHVERLRRGRLAERILVVRYEDACARPREAVRRALDFCGLTDSAGHVLAAADALSAPAERPYEDAAAAWRVWSEVRSVATLHGYDAPAASQAAAQPDQARRFNGAPAVVRP